MLSHNVNIWGYKPKTAAREEGEYIYSLLKGLRRHIQQKRERDHSALKATLISNFPFSICIC